MLSARAVDWGCAAVALRDGGVWLLYAHRPDDRRRQFLQHQARSVPGAFCFGASLWTSPSRVAANLKTEQSNPPGKPVPDAAHKLMPRIGRGSGIPASATPLSCPAHHDMPLFLVAFRPNVLDSSGDYEMPLGAHELPDHPLLTNPWSVWCWKRCKEPCAGLDEVSVFSLVCYLKDNRRRLCDSCQQRG